MAVEALNLGKTYMCLEKYPDAESYLSFGYRISSRLRLARYSFEAAGQLAELYKATADWPKAYLWQGRKAELQDSLRVMALHEKTAQLQEHYETERKEMDAALLKKDRELRNVFLYGVVLVVLLLVVICVLMTNRYRTVRNVRRVRELEKKRNDIFHDLHYDMGSALSNINIISKVAMENAEERVKVTDHLRAIHENSGYTLENMSDIVWTTNPVNDTLEKLVSKMREFAEDILTPLNIQYSFEQEGNFRDKKLDLGVRKDLYFIFKEMVGNAAKYSRGTRMAIQVSGNDRQLELEVRDNGFGVSRYNIINGNGLRNMEDRARQINGVLTVSSVPGQGTTVKLRVKINT
jgi:signal transduction histidine kinase